MAKISYNHVEHLIKLHSRYLACGDGMKGLLLDKNSLALACQAIVAASDKGPLIPMPVKARSYNNRATVLWFADNTFTKCVVDEGTPYDLDTGITICLFKKMLGADGNKKYHKMMRFVHDGMEEEKKAREAELALKKLHREENARMKAKADARRAKRRQEQIDIQAEAYKKAMIELGNANYMVKEDFTPVEEIMIDDIPADSEYEYGAAKAFLNDVHKLVEEDLDDQIIAEKMGFQSVRNYRKHKAECAEIVHKHNADIYRELRAKGMSRKQIAIELGLNESTIRSLANYVKRVDSND